MNEKNKIRTYSELILLPTFEERFNYLKLDGTVAEATFGWERYLNQIFYKSPEWKEARRDVILRDLGHDLACKDDRYEIMGSIYIHHMNPISPQDIIDRVDELLNIEYLICTSSKTHRAIHYGDESLLDKDPIVRYPNDMCPWKK